MENINWVEIQDFYNDNHTWSDIMIEYKISNYALLKATKNGLLITRSRSDANKISHIKKQRKLSEETKKKISISRKKFLKEHPDQVPYLLNHNSKKESYPEIYFQDILQKNELIYERYLQISIYNLDFAFIDKGIDLEIDGDQHILDKRILKSNIQRDIFLKENGWKVIRVLWSDYQRLKKEQKEEYIIDLMNYINGSCNNIPTIINNRNYCKCGKEIYNTSKCCKCCSGKNQKRKVNRPTIEQLLLDIKELGYCGTGRKYNVSDNSIRKWIK